MSQDVMFDIKKVRFSENMANFSDSLKYKAFLDHVEKSTDSELFTSFYNLNFEQVKLTQQSYNKHIRLMETRKSECKGFLWMQTYMFGLILNGNTLSEDSIASYCNQIKRSAMEEYTPLDAFMRVWSFAISVFSNNGYCDKAFEEAQLMIKEAKRINYHEGLIYINGTVARMLYKQRLYKQSIRYYNGALLSIKQAYEEETGHSEILEKDYNYRLYTSTLIESLISQIRAEEYQMGQNTMLEIDRVCNNESNYSSLLLYGKGLFYNKLGDEKKFWETARIYEKQLAERGLLEHPEKAGWQMSSVYHYYQILAEYYLSHHQPLKALKYCRIMDSMRPTPSTTAKALMGAKQYQEAANIYKQLYEETDSLYLNDQNNTVGKFAAFMENENLQLKFLSTQMEVQEIQLSLTRVVIGAMIIIILIGAGFLYRNGKLMKKVHVSKNNLQVKNEELIQKEKEIRRALAQAEEASRVKMSFLNNITHEMRTPLSGIVGFTQLLSPHTDDESLIIKEIHNNTNQLVQLIDTTIDLSDYDTGDKELTFTKIDLNSCCFVAIDQIRSMVPPDVSLNLVLPQEKFSIYSNEEAIIKLLSCLLHNAAKFTQQGKIEIGYIVGEEDVQVYVQDTGKGIPSDKVKWIFKRFAKIDEFIPGFGLGLPLASAIASRIHGKIELDTDYTCGSRFVVTLRNK